jgi:hypothetical protein
VLGVARVESQIFDRPKVKTGPKNLKGSRDECPPSCVDDFFSSLFFSFFLLSWILIVMGKQPLEHGILQPLRACELIIDNLLCHALRHQQLASLTGLSAWSGLMYSRLKDILLSFKPPNQINTRGFHVDNSHAMVCFSTTCFDNLSLAVASKLCLISLV